MINTPLITLISFVAVQFVGASTIKWCLQAATNRFHLLLIRVFDDLVAALHLENILSKPQTVSGILTGPE